MSGNYNVCGRRHTDRLPTVSSEGFRSDATRRDCQDHGWVEDYIDHDCAAFDVPRDDKTGAIVLMASAMIMTALVTFIASVLWL